MMLGIAASSSMAAPIGPLRKFGAISVTNMAIPIATGTAINMDNTVVIAVPKRLVAAPNDSFTGFQSVEEINPHKPNFSIERDDSEINVKRIPTINAMTDRDARPETSKKIKSTGFFL
jgi:hypothetical protein